MNRSTLVCSHSLVQSLTLGKIKIEGALMNILQQAVQCIHPLPFNTSTAGFEAYNLNNEHPSSSLMLSTTSLSSITLLLPQLPRSLPLMCGGHVITPANPFLIAGFINIAKIPLALSIPKGSSVFFFNPNCICPQCLDQKVPVRQQASSCCW